MEVVISNKTKNYLYSKSKNFWISKNNFTEYERGFLGNGKKPFLPVFFGLLGEKAFSIITKKNVNFNYIVGGDKGYDFILNNKKINVKLSLNKNKKIAGYIKVKKLYNCDIFVFSKTNFNQNKIDTNQNVNVKFLGYLDKKDLGKQPKRNGIDGKPMYVVDVNNLKPMRELIYG